MDVSIIICTRDRGATLSGTLRSLAAIRSALDWEVILLDNGSIDNTASVIAAADDCGGRLHYAFYGEPGLGGARDFAWRLAKGRICSFSDDDCYLDPGFVDAIAAAFADHPDAGCIGGRILLFDPDDARLAFDEREHPSRYAPYSYFPGGALQGANMSFRTSVLERIGGFDRELGAGTPFPCEDVDVITASLWAGCAAWFDPRPLVYHHHGRRGDAADRAVAGYDRGRGVYHAKYVLRQDTRWHFMRKWLVQGRWNRFLTQAALTREFAGSRAYFRHRSATLAGLAMEPFYLLVRIVKMIWDVRALKKTAS
jgi:glycosyltransferase involved in cell wall biosynthesis